MDLWRTRPPGVGVDVLSLARWRAVVDRHGPGLAQQLGIHPDALHNGEGALRFSLVECAVKATPDTTLFGMMEALRGVGIKVTSEKYPHARLPWPGGMFGVMAVACWASGQSGGHLISVLVPAPLRVEVAVAPVVTQASQDGRNLLRQMANGGVVVAPPDAAPTVDGRPASLAHDGTLVAAAVLRQDEG